MGIGLVVYGIWNGTYVHMYSGTFLKRTLNRNTSLMRTLSAVASIGLSLDMMIQNRVLVMKYVACCAFLVCFGRPGVLSRSRKTCVLCSQPWSPCRHRRDNTRCSLVNSLVFIATLCQCVHVCVCACVCACVYTVLLLFSTFSLRVLQLTVCT